MFGEAIMLKYGSKHSTVSEYQLDRFAIVTRNSREALNLVLLPLIFGATYQLSLRTFLQVLIWLGNSPNLVNYGWKKTNTINVSPGTDLIPISSSRGSDNGLLPLQQ
ncbi:hypothetical protein EVAR_42813_1 [Eumeta japonica]|uniref:Uncharacterized protein n=1 Tax=Eumeta variegata TaxID=151549 RepID=A0A4C1WHY1_EUMVA|nr:hypothetical protein EVAR_42813_1 [Eumeta japonica]